MSLRASRLVLWSALSLAAVPLGACGGSSGGGGDDGGGGGGGGSTAGAPPSATLLLPTTGVVAFVGDRVPVTFTANDDGIASVRFVLDADGNLGTTADQPTVFGPAVDTNGLLTRGLLTTSGVAPGKYTLFLIVRDGGNADAVDALPGPFVLLSARATVAPPRSSLYGVQGDRVALVVSEADQGPGADLNGDADAVDGVLATLNTLTGTYTQHPTSADVTGVDPAGTARRLDLRSTFGFVPTLEADEGPINGDLDALDSMTTIYGTAGPSLFTHTFGGLLPTGLIVGTRSVCTLREAEEGGAGTDQTSDGDTLDTVVALLDGATNVRTVFPMALQSGTDVRGNGSFAVFVVSEVDQGVSLNGDGDATDALLALMEVPLSTLHDLVGRIDPAVQQPRCVQPGAGFAPSSDSRVGFYVDEQTEGADVNGDGDQLDRVPAIWRYSVLGQTESLPGVGAGIRLDAGNLPTLAEYAATKFLYTAREEATHTPAQGDNGDGEQADQRILWWTDHALDANLANVLNPALPAFPTLTGLALDGGTLTRIAPTWVAVTVSEAANGGLDLSGEGLLGTALLLINCQTTPPTVHNPGLSPAAMGRIPVEGVSGTAGLVVSVPETTNGVLNGDGDTLETFLFFVPFATPGLPVLLTATGGIDAVVAGTHVAVTAQESLTGSDHNGDGDVSDFVLRVLSTAGAVELEGQLCPPTSRPATETGALWAYLRHELLEGRDLNADGDSTDFVVGFWRP